MEEDADETLFRIAPAGHISNPNFAHDSTLPVFLEMMFEDLPHISRRTSIADRMRALQTKHVSFPERLMNRLRTPSSSRPETCEKDSLGNLKVDSKVGLMTFLARMHSDMLRSSLH